MIDDLVAVLGANAVQIPDAPLMDICRFDLGQPRAVVRPTTAHQVVEVMAVAAQHAMTVVPVGERTAYWRPLHLNGAIAVQSGGIRGIHIDGERIRCGAGEPVRLIDQTLRAAGRHLSIHPDAFGDTGLGAMVSCDCRSGIGMGNGPFSDWLTGIEVVTGGGDKIWVDEPDALRMFVGAEGCLGLITAVEFIAPKTPWRAHLSAKSHDPLALARVAQALGEDRDFDTFRCTQQTERDEPSSAWTADIWIQSSVSLDDALERAEACTAALLEPAGIQAQLTAEPESARAGRSPEYDARFNGPIGAHHDFVQAAHFVGIDVVCGYPGLPKVIALMEDFSREQQAYGALSTRLALYCAPDFVNVGLHSSLPKHEAAVAWSRTHQSAAHRALADAGVMPYRAGRVWPVDPVTPERRTALRELKAQLDPTGRLCPDHPWFG